MNNEGSTINQEQARYDAQADILYFISTPGPIDHSEEIAPGISLEYTAQGSVAGIEVLRASEVLSKRVVAFLHAKQAGVIGKIE